MPKTLGINEAFFKKWSAEMAYILGFFSADGCLTINPRSSHYIEFSCNDKDVLEKIKRALKSDHKIGGRKRVNPNWKKSYRLQIGSKKMFNDLVKFGFTVNKTETVSLPKIPKKYFADYLRGYFDGDGCINYGYYHYKDRRAKKYHILFRLVCKNKKYLIDLSKQIKNLVDTKGKNLFAHGNAFGLSYSTKDSLKILNFIYNKPTIYLTRKFKNSNQAIKNYYKLVDR